VVLYDGETGTLHNHCECSRRGRSDDHSDLSNSDPSAGTWWRLLCSLVEHPRRMQCSMGWLRNHQPGDHPTRGHTAPANGYITRTVNVTAPMRTVEGQGRLRPTGSRS